MGGKKLKFALAPHESRALLELVPISVYVAAWSVIRYPLAAHHGHGACRPAASPLATVRPAAAAAVRLGVVVHGRHGREELEGVGQLRQPFEELLMRVRVAGEGGEVRVVVVGRVRGWRCGLGGAGLRAGVKAARGAPRRRPARARAPCRRRRAAARR